MDFQGMGFKWGTQLSSLLTAGKKAWNITVTGENLELPQFLMVESFQTCRKRLICWLPHWANCDVWSTLSQTSVEELWVMSEFLPGSFLCLGHSQVALSERHWQVDLKDSHDIRERVYPGKFWLACVSRTRPWAGDMEVNLWQNTPSWKMVPESSHWDLMGCVRLKNWPITILSQITSP